MVQNLVLALSTLLATQEETPVANPSSYLSRVLPFVRRAERGVLDQGSYTEIQDNWIAAYRINDLRDSFRVVLSNATFEVDDHPRHVRCARIDTLERILKQPEARYDPTQELEHSLIEPLLKEYAAAAGYPGQIKVVGLSRPSNSIYVTVAPVWQGVRYASNTNSLFEIDYRNGRLISMRLYGHPRPPASSQPGIQPGAASAGMLQRIFARYAPPGVQEVSPVKLVIWGSPEPIENDDAVKYSQRIWSVQGKLAYEASFGHIETFGPAQTPIRRYRVIVDASNGDLITMSELAPAGLLGKPNPLASAYKGEAALFSGAKRTVVRDAALAICDEKTLGSGKRFGITIGKISLNGEYEKKSGLYVSGGRVFKPNSSLKRALDAALIE